MHANLGRVARGRAPAEPANAGVVSLVAAPSGGRRERWPAARRCPRGRSPRRSCRSCRSPRPPPPGRCTRRRRAARRASPDQVAPAACQLQGPGGRPRRGGARVDRERDRAGARAGVGPCAAKEGVGSAVSAPRRRGHDRRGGLGDRRRLDRRLDRGRHGLDRRRLTFTGGLVTTGARLDRERRGPGWRRGCRRRPAGWPWRCRCPAAAQGRGSRPTQLPCGAPSGRAAARPVALAAEVDPHRHRAPVARGVAGLARQPGVVSKVADPPAGLVRLTFGALSVRRALRGHDGRRARGEDAARCRERRVGWGSGGFASSSVMRGAPRRGGGTGSYPDSKVHPTW